MRLSMRPTSLILIALLVSACSDFDDPSLDSHFDPEKVLEPIEPAQVAHNTERNLLFGDLHIHTSLSTDAYVFGNRSLPEDVYRFAKGGTIEHGAGYAITIDRQLDFVAVTDHSEYLGQARLANLDVPTANQSLRELLQGEPRWKITKAWLESTNFIRKLGFGFGVDQSDEQINHDAWQMTIDAAERHNVPGAFTAFIGYEWSAFAGDPTIHIHRNVIYRGSDVSLKPFSYIDSPVPEDLWDFLEQENTAGRVAMAIPHNANLSDGNMYQSKDSDGKRLTKEYASLRNRYEPISEILQVKGASETHPLLSPLDEFANFEITSLAIGGDAPEMTAVQGAYMRDALKAGLEFEKQEGFNPYQFGVIGSSDSHNASSPAQEKTYHGKLPMMDGSAGLRTNETLLLPQKINPVTRWGSGGLAGVWAEENTRESIYDALLRKETFATSGPRIGIRLFAGWDFEKNILASSQRLKLAYEGGVPMGGELLGQAENVSPEFMILAHKDPLGAKLDRVQIIKGWVDDSGISHEKIYDVVWSTNRSGVNQDGKLQTVGNTVNLNNGDTVDTIGSSTLESVWHDPDFSADQNAFYYARVLEIPTARWSTYDAIKLGTEPMAPATIQERAITSAIWYSAPLVNY